MIIFNSRKKAGKTPSDLAKPTGQRPKDNEELTQTSLEEIAGGLNPQPIPPGRQATFTQGTGTGKTSQF